MRRSIAFTITGSSPELMRARVGSNVEYALAVELGHGVIRPKGGRQYLRFPSTGKGKTPKGQMIYVRQVPARPATPYLRPALRALGRR